MTLHWWLRLSTGLDALSDWIGQRVRYLTLFMVLVGGYNAIVRYLGRFTGTNLSSNAYIEVQWYMFSVLFLLAAPYALRHNAHVRVDVLHAHLSARARAWIEVLGTLLFLIPFSILMLVTAWPSVRNAWAVLEKSPDPGGLPRYPLKGVILIAFVLLILQGTSELIKAIAILLKREGDDGKRSAESSARFSGREGQDGE